MEHIPIEKRKLTILILKPLGLVVGCFNHIGTVSKH